MCSLKWREIFMKIPSEMKFFCFLYLRENHLIVDDVYNWHFYFSGLILRLVFNIIYLFFFFSLSLFTFHMLCTTMVSRIFMFHLNFVLFKSWSLEYQFCQYKYGFEHKIVLVYEYLKCQKHFLWKQKQNTTAAAVC